MFRFLKNRRKLTETISWNIIHCMFFSFFNSQNCLLGKKNHFYTNLCVSFHLIFANDLMLFFVNCNNCLAHCGIWRIWNMFYRSFYNETCSMKYVRKIVFWFIIIVYVRNETNKYRDLIMTNFKFIPNLILLKLYFRFKRHDLFLFFW